MKKSVMAAALAGVMLLSGCSGTSQENSNSTNSANSNSQTGSSSSSSVNLSSTSEKSGDTNLDNKEFEDNFNAKCKNIVEQMLSIYDSMEYNVQLTESSANYNNDNDCFSKIYAVKVSGNSEDERLVVAFLDISNTDEYEYFQNAKNFISFVDENSLEICGRNQYMIAINATDMGYSDISISNSTSSKNIIYGNRAIQSAYSERLKSMEFLKDCDEQLSLPGLIKFADLPKNSVSYDITCEYQGKTLTHKWYKLDNGKDNHNYVTYIDDGTYDDMTDEELLFYAYVSLFDEQNELNRYGNNFYFAYKSGENLACSITYYDSSAFRDWSSCRWIGEYERLNSHDFNIELLNILTGKAVE